MHARIQADWAWSISMNMRKQAGGHTKNSAELAGTGRKLSAELAGTGRTHPKTQHFTNLLRLGFVTRKYGKFTFFE